MGKVVVIGAGASGILAALKASEKNEVILLESNAKIGKKLLITGNGKCNFWNDSIATCKYQTDNASVLEEILTKKEDVFEYLTTTLGIYPVNKNGYLYPNSCSAASIVECLSKNLLKRNIQILYNLTVLEITDLTDKVSLLLSDNTLIYADRVIIATGGKAAPNTGSTGSGYKLLEDLGYKINPVIPALVPLISDASYLKNWNGIRVNALLTFKSGSTTFQEEGELQLTNYGISGIVTFNLSNIIGNYLNENQEVKIFIDFLPQENYLLEKLETSSKNLLKPTVEELLETYFNYKLLFVFLNEANIKGTSLWGNLKDNEKERLVTTIKNFELSIKATGNFEKAQVCNGGLSLNYINNKLQLVNNKKIAVVGEILDVAGFCGGFNLAFAFISGYIAGENIND